MKQLLQRLLLIASMSCLPLSARDNPDFTRLKLQVKGRISDLKVVDINGDKLPDIIISHAGRQFTLKTFKYISFFIQTKNGFSSQPSSTWLYSDKDIFWDLIDIDGDELPELLLLKKDGLYASSWMGNNFDPAPTKLISAAIHFPGSSTAAPRRLPLTLDLEKDGLPELVVPLSESIRIYQKTTSGFRIKLNLHVIPTGTFSNPESPVYTFTIPRITAADFNGDNISDLLVINRDVLDLYIRFPSKPSHTAKSRLPDKRFKMQSRILGPSVFAGQTNGEVRIETTDLNNDGYIDLILSKAPGARFRTGISQVQIFLNQQGEFRDFPDQILTADNFGGDHIITDLNGDGLMDIALLTFPLGFTQAARFLLTKKTANSYEIYLLQPDGKYHSTPDRRINFNRAVALDNIMNDSPLRSMQHDFTGDGLADFIISTDMDKLTVFPGEPNSSFSRKKSFIITTAGQHNFLPVNLNHDKISDLLLWDKTSLSGQSTLTLLFSTTGTAK